MYSVEDLLISHGYKLTRSGPPSGTPYDKRPEDFQAVENRAGRGTLNGYEAERGGSTYGSRLVKGNPTDNEGVERNQRKKEAGSGNLGDAQALGDSLATDSGFYDVPSLSYSEHLSHDERDVSYWRRRGQDFSVLLDYADGRELRASTGSWRPQALIAAEEHRFERRQQQRLWEDISWLRDPDSAPGQLRVTGERKCQSLGTEEWRPAVGLGRQLSDGDGERWTQEQYRLRSTEGAFHPRTKGKSQSLPRVLSPDGTEHPEMVQSRPSLPDRPQRVSSTVFSGPYSRYYYSGNIGRDRWGRNGWPSGHVALLPKPRFSRPVKPPSYEIHQQTRGSSEMLAVDMGSKQKDRSIYYPGGGELQRQDYYAQHSAIYGMEPPGYIPPPSYRRAPPPPKGVPVNRNEVVSLRWRAEALQMPVSSEAGRWFSRQTGGSWLEHYGDRGMPYRKQGHPGYEEHPRHGRYLPCEDPRVRHISGGPGGNSPADSDKIPNFNKEIPCTKVSGQSTSDSAFPPQQGLSINAESRQTSLDNENLTRWSNRGINKGCESVAPEQSCGSKYPTSFQVRPPPPSKPAPPPPSKPPIAPPSKPPIAPPSKPPIAPSNKPPIAPPNKPPIAPPNKPPIAPSNKPPIAPSNKPPIAPPNKPPPPPPCKPVVQDVAETVMETKNQDPPDPEKEKPKKDIKKKLSETIFCLVSVPVPSQSGGTLRDQNNNDEKSPDPVESPSENKTGHLTNQSLQSTSSAEAELQALTGSIASSKTSSRASSKMVRKLPCRPPKINHYKELKLSGSWPANQYRDQETQTSPEAPKPTAPGPQNKEAQEPAPPGTDASPGSGVGGTTFSYPIKGVKSLTPSSNSAFSLTSTFSSQLNKSTAQQPATPPSGNVDEAKPAPSGGQEAFGQFLLKAVSGKPWDAIEELETINKELQDQQSSKRPSVDQCIEDLNEAYKDILELGTASNKVPDGSVQIPERIKIRLPGEPLNKPSSLRRSMDRWSVSVNPEYREVKSAFSRPATKSVTFSKQLREELPVPPRDTGFREYRVVSHLLRRRNSDGRTVKLDLQDEPIETTIDFSPAMPTTAAEVPWADRQPMQDASTLTSPPDYEDICQSLRQSKDSNEVNKGSAGNDADPPQDHSADSEQECPICRRESENQMRQAPMPPLHEEDSSDSSANHSSVVDDSSPPICAASERRSEDTNTKESTDSGSNPPELPETREQPSLTEDSLGSSETDRAPGEDPHDPWKGSSAEGVPENQSIEERAARILGIDVPAESLVTGEQRVSKAATQQMELTDSIPVVVDLPEGRKQTDGVKDECKDAGEQDTKPPAVLEPTIVLRSHLGRENPGLPEFPPERLPLSVPPNPDHRLSVSLEGDRRARGPSQRIEALQDKLASSPTRVAIERLARMKEVDSVSRMRRLSIRSSDSVEGEGEKEEGPRVGRLEEPLTAPQGDTEEDQEVCCPQQTTTETVLQPEEVPSLAESCDPRPVE